MSDLYTEATNGPQKILILEQDTLYGTIIGEMLREGSHPPCEVTLVDTLDAGLNKLTQEVFDSILVDLGLHNQQWQALISQIREQTAETPIIVLAQAQAETRAVESLKYGAQDYLIKGGFKVQNLTRTIRNACERQRLQLELERSLKQKLDVVERRFQQMIVQNADGIVVLNTDGLVQYINPKAAAFFGRESTDFLGRKFDFVSFDNPVQELTLTTDEGNPLYVELRIAPMDWGDELAHLVSIRDVTARKKNEQKLEQVAANLKAQNEDLDAYAHTVAHDIKAPLSIMIGFTAALFEQHRELDPDDLERYLHNVYRSGRKAESIINELLLLASVRQQKVELSPIDMGYVVNQAKTRLEYMFEDHKAELHMPSRWPLVQGYAPWIEEVWANYLSNALKYGGKPPTVTLNYEERETDVKFWVEDNGRGLSEEDQKELFKQFPKINSMRVDGHGLGLSIVRRIITRLGGRVGMESVSPTGSRFYFTLPKNV